MKPAHALLFSLANGLALAAPMATVAHHGPLLVANAATDRSNSSIETTSAIFPASTTVESIARQKLVEPYRIIDDITNPSTSLLPSLKAKPVARDLGRKIFEWSEYGPSKKDPSQIMSGFAPIVEIWEDFLNRCFPGFSGDELHYQQRLSGKDPL